MKLPELTIEERKLFEGGVIQVNGKAMNRTALGIIAAYFKLYPKTTLAELKEAFPDSINPSGPRAPKTIFKPFTDRDFGVVHSLEKIQQEFAKAGLPYEGLFFLGKDETFQTSDGITVIVNRLWESNDTLTGGNDLEKLATQAIKFGIVINKYEPRSPFGKGSYSLDLLQPELAEKMSGKSNDVRQGVIREKTVDKKGIPRWVWIVGGLILILIIILIAGVLHKK